MSGCNGNYFLINRRIFESDIWLHPDKLRLFLYLLGQARWKEEPNEKYKNKGVVIERGQFLRSYRMLQRDLEYFENNAIKNHSLSQINRIIEQLENEGRIETEKTELGTLFTVCNYDKYQLRSDKKQELGTELEQGWNADGTELEQYSNKGVRREKEREIQNRVPHQKIKELYNKHRGDNMPAVRSISDRRKEHLRARWKEVGGIETFEEVFVKAGNSRFMNGDNNRGWTADFDWIVKNDNNFTKVLEGKYDNEKMFSNNGKVRTRKVRK